LEQTHNDEERTHFTDNALALDLLFIAAGALRSCLGSVVGAAHRRLSTRPRSTTAAAAGATAAVLVRPVVLGRQPGSGGRGRHGRRGHTVGRVGTERVVA